MSTQVESTRRTEGGQLVQGMQVHFVTGYGVTGSVFVPNATFSEPKVRQLISAKVAELNKVSELGTAGKG